MKQGSREDLGDENIIVISRDIVLDRSSRTVHLFKTRLASEDIVALGFAEILEGLGIRYAVVAGYVAILFGRARRSDDIDFVAEDVTEEGFIELCRKASRRGFTLMQGEIYSDEHVRNVYRRYLSEGYSLRFMYRDMVVPNIEFRLATTSLHRYAINNSYRVVINNKYTVRISPLELQIAYKLYLGSDKDIGDAVFLYTLFREAISLEELYTWCERLGVDCRVLEG